MAHKKSKRTVSLRGKVVTEVLVPKPVVEVVTEKTVRTTEPEVEIRRPATLAQALTEPAVLVVKPKTRIRKVVGRTIRSAA
jgi:hypothetical protein